MPKLSDLDGLHDPVAGAEDLAHQQREAQLLLDRITDLIDGGHRSTPFLWSLHETVSRTKRVTRPQREAGERMEDEQDRPRGRSRRYQGFDGCLR